MIAVVVRSYPASGLDAIAHYLTHEARYLALETHDGSALPATLSQFAAAVARRPTGLALTQLALSLAPHEQGTPDAMFAAGSALLAEMGLHNRPTVAVLHGPPNAAHPHLHLVAPLIDGVTGEWQPLSRLPRLAWEAATIVAPRFGWAPPPPDDRERRREPRAARSLGAWHGQRSLHAWLGEVVGPQILGRLDGARSWAEVGAALAAFGLRYARTERGAVIEDHSSAAVRRVPASALAFRVSANALEPRLGPTPRFPAPEDARTNPAAYANDNIGRNLGIGTPAEERAFAGAHATWRAVWLPVREQRLAEQRAREAARRATLTERILELRAIRDAVAGDRVEWLDANRFVRAYRDVGSAALRERAQAERAALRTLPFAQRPPSRFREWLRTQHGSPAAVPALRGEEKPARVADDGGLVAGEGALRRLRGLAGIAEWWSGRRRVAIDAGTEIVVCDRVVLPAALACAERRWSRIHVVGDQAFRDAAHALATAAGIVVHDIAREEREVFTLPEVPDHARVRTCAAIAQHLGLNEVILGGMRLRPGRWEGVPPERDLRGTLCIDEADAVALEAGSEALHAMAGNGFVPALEVDGTAVFPFPAGVTANERTAIVVALARAYSVRRREVICIDGPVQYYASNVCDGFQRLLASMRPTVVPVSFGDRVRTIQRFFDDLMPPSLEPQPSVDILTSAARPVVGRQRASRTR